MDLAARLETAAPLRQAAGFSWREAGQGGGVPLVLLHGIGSNAASWLGQFEAFSAERRVIAWNAPGYGETAHLPVAAPVARDYGQALWRLLDHLGVGRCILVGQSLGAIMATAAARLEPTRVAALILASPATGYAVPAGGDLPETIVRRISDIHELGPEGMAQRRAMRLVTDGASPAVRALVRGAMAAVDPKGYEQATRLLAGSDLPALLEGVTLPGLVLWGAEDVVTPPAGCRRIADAFVGARQAEVPALGHAFATEGPQQFNEAIRPILLAADHVIGD
ncbi:alpha/beta fold hydrolase [Novosphingobium profundi]|uniref:alpha/beta fold hydrolase n=1 Tax=Novosphingobium profundi TaxID=1774954 RepID=UPI001BD99372|nr:alpha/beta fold hydrolase [Novosphingobium profundi]MBT0668153.1 alpha/beta fold hydrolase [Novosphingobium profundi]